MNADVALFWTQEAMKLAVLICAPMLGAALAVGLLVSVFQAVTSIQEMTLSYIPKMLAVAAVLLFLSPWMITMLTDFSTSVFQFIPDVSR